MITIEHDDSYYNCTCPVCGKKFHIKPSHLPIAKTHHCSKQCFNIAKHDYMKGENNHQYGLKGSKNASWISDKRLSRYGYILIRQPNHPFRNSDDFVFEHRLIAEQNLLTPECTVEIQGHKYLSPNYVVHHKNFNRTDNRVENLQIMTSGEHRSLHNRLNPRPRNKKGQFMKKEPISISIKKATETAVIPQRQSIGAAGYDLYADTTEDVMIKPHETRVISSGIAFAIPKDYFGAIYARSGLATKQGLRPSTCVSVIDSDYRGIVGLPLYNDSNEVRCVKPQERIAQIVFQKALITDLEVVDELDDTERGVGGFGSSGM